MSFLLNLIERHKCRSSHHRIAMDALALLDGPSSQGWRDLFLAHHAGYLSGAKAPDTRFKDFCNHVLHVGENDWGGAIKKAEEWYERTAHAFAEENWSEAVFNAGVLSHYVADPCQPLHTGQSEEEGALHRPFEWAVAKSYDTCRERMQALGGYPDIPIEESPDWLATIVRDGAVMANREYTTILDHFDVHAAQNRPEDGLDDTLRDAMGRLIGRATAGFAAILNRALKEADVAPPDTDLRRTMAQTVLEVPLHWALKHIEDADERASVKAMYEELLSTGKVLRELPEDDAEVRRMHAVEVTKTPLRVLDAQPIRALGRKHGGRLFVIGEAALSMSALRGENRSEDAPTAAKLAPPPRAEPTPKAEPTPNRAPAPKPRRSSAKSGPPKRFQLELDNAVIDAPSIGPKTAARLRAIGVETVGDLLDLHPPKAAKELAVRHISANTLTEWQAQARLILVVPHLRGHDAQILAACGVRDPSYLARLSPDALLASVRPFALSSRGQRILRGGDPPDREEVQRWITWAQEARSLEAA